MDKLLTYPGKDHRGIHTFVIEEERGYLTKTASQYHPTIAAYINAAKPMPGMMQILLTALGAGEWWGDNSNADWFGESELAHEGVDFGYKTFEYHAKVFKHHVNKPDSQSYGKVLLSVYNPVYHRVELIVGVDRVAAPDIIEGMDNGNYPVWSMGCKIPYDICSICGNKAPSRKFYCEHLKYFLGQIHPETGRKVYAINIKPKFFDISHVIIPADKTAMTLKKVAFASGVLCDAQGRIISSAELAEKTATEDKEASINKEADIVKILDNSEPPGSSTPIDGARAANLARGIMEVKSREPHIPAHVLDRLAQMGNLGEVLSSLSACLIMPKPQEFQRLVLVSRGEKDVADKLDSLQACFDPTSVPLEQAEGHFPALGLSPQHVRPDMLKVLEPYISARSYAAPVLVRRIEIMVKQADAFPEAQMPPRYVNPNNGSSGSAIPGLALGASLYMAMTSEKARMVIADIIKKHPIAAVAAASGIFLYAANAKNSDERFKGRYTPNQDLHPDTADIYDRIERMRERPYLKTASDSLGSRAMGAASRLLIGVPTAYMVSNALQKRRNMTPNDEQGMIARFVRDHPHVISGALAADALLALKGKGSYALTRPLVEAQKMWLSGDHLKKAAGVVEDELPTPEMKSASVQDYVSSSVLWPLATGTANLPGRMIGSFLDQAALDFGSKLIRKRNEQKAPVGPHL